MRRIRLSVGSAVALTVFLAGCSGAAGGSPTSGATTTAPASSASVPTTSNADPAAGAAPSSNSVGPIYTKDTLGPAIAKNVPQPLTYHLEQEMTVVNNGVTQHATISGDMHVRKVDT